MAHILRIILFTHTVYPKKYVHGFVVLCFVVVLQSFIMNSHEVFIHIHQGCFAGIGAIVRLPQCQWSKPDGYGKISQCITTTKHSKAKTVCIFLGIYCLFRLVQWVWTAPVKSSIMITQQMIMTRDYVYGIRQYKVLITKISQSKKILGRKKIGNIRLMFIHFF